MTRPEGQYDSSSFFLGAGLFADKIVKVNVRVKYPHYLGINFKDCRLEVCD